jgi:3-methyladenine DNA glycosylase AlkD
MNAVEALTADLRRGLASVAEPAKAGPMQAYMKSELPFYGVPRPAQERVFREVLSRHPLPDESTWRGAVLSIWHGATHREERYAALALTGHRLYRSYQMPAVLDLYDELIVTGAWWDLVDEVATRRIGPILRGFPPEVGPVVRHWAGDDSLWKRRTAVICQVGSKQATDTALLRDCIAPNLDRREFWLRKAIGWALREFAKTDAAWVQRYVSEHSDALSPLSRRQALKNVGPG